MNYYRPRSTYIIKLCLQIRQLSVQVALFIARTADWVMKSPHWMLEALLIPILVCEIFPIKTNMACLVAPCISNKMGHFYFSRLVHWYLNELFPGRWIWRRRPGCVVCMIARSDTLPLIFRGEKIHVNWPENLMDLKNTIRPELKIFVENYLTTNWGADADIINKFLILQLNFWLSFGKINQYRRDLYATKSLKSVQTKKSMWASSAKQFCKFPDLLLSVH